MLTYVVKFLFTLCLMDFAGDGHLSEKKIYSVDIWATTLVDIWATQNYNRIIEQFVLNPLITDKLKWTINDTSIYLKAWKGWSIPTVGMYI